MGKREELRHRLKKYADSNLSLLSGYMEFMKGVDAAMAEFVFDDEKTPIDVSIEEVKTRWFSPYTAPADNTSVLAKYTDGEEPEHEVIDFVDGEWWNPQEVRRLFVWTRIPK